MGVCPGISVPRSADGSHTVAGSRDHFDKLAFGDQLRGLAVEFAVERDNAAERGRRIRLL